MFCSGKRSLKPRVILLTYPTSLSMQGQHCSDFVSIEDRAKLLVEDLSSLDLKNKPTIFIGHSMGGLIIKSMLIQGSGQPMFSSIFFLCQTSSHPQKAEEIMPFVRGVVFYSTPHFGSKLAGYASNPMISKVLSPSTDITELNDKASHLPRLNAEFLNVFF